MRVATSLADNLGQDKPPSASCRPSLSAPFINFVGMRRFSPAVRLHRQSPQRVQDLAAPPMKVSFECGRKAVSSRSRSFLPKKRPQSETEVTSRPLQRWDEGGINDEG